MSPLTSIAFESITLSRQKYYVGNYTGLLATPKIEIPSPALKTSHAVPPGLSASSCHCGPAPLPFSLHLRISNPLLSTAWVTAPLTSCQLHAPQILYLKETSPFQNSGSRAPENRKNVRAGRGCVPMPTTQTGVCGCVVDSNQQLMGGWMDG